MAFVESIATQARRLETALNQALLRLQSGTDAEALHDLRINLRRVRSLLRPLRGASGVARLDSAAAGLGKLTTPVRDLEVLIAELARHQLDWQANVRKTELQNRYASLVSEPLLLSFPPLLRAWPNALLKTRRRHLKRRLRQRLRLQVQRLARALADPDYDRHRLRLLVKRVRYVADAYPSLSPIAPAAAASLKAAQSALGDWHDRFVWCQLAEHQQDLWPLLPHWQSARDAALKEAERALASLSPALKSAAHHNTD
ncbi:Uncharacterized conserved protein [Serratia entomophila]|uniref:CHAD domain-containing protein n=1 Tax=Serratia entomophila TaxID=42906 RepID=UPI00217764E6|nr:CHAD domain-containing protein [Serratia entomophila]CAI1119305.1 Uncharacterized conserved protein [Serratia entomophila]CAI1138039.1 Uncharacterized conserved protein [Serratia entomophila]CAI1142125.1 Uncharacterized conserved protein [Serratia entomophila]CAI1856828.1 Uncharacterized conserved protein [Serratia entomophila]CAI1892754.1 Uncharacterized conserved protein [Serratia entomophila]